MCLATLDSAACCVQIVAGIRSVTLYPPTTQHRLILKLKTALLPATHPWDLASAHLPLGQGHMVSYSPAILPSMGACGMVGKEQAPLALQARSAQCDTLRDSSLLRGHLARGLELLASPRCDGCCRTLLWGANGSGPVPSASR